jgi:glucosyl-3-phosphoglycerate synthase
MLDEMQLGRSKTAARRRPARKILVPALSCDPGEPLIPLAHSLSEGRQVLVLGIVPVEANHSLSEAAAQTQELRTKLRQSVADLGGRLWPKIVASHHPEYEITAFIAEQNIDLMVLPWLNRPSIYKSMVEAVLERAACNVVVLQGSPPKPKGDVLIVLRPGPDSELALRLGLNLTRTGNHTITTLRPTGMADVDPDENAIPGLEQVLQHLPQVQDAVLLADDPSQAILEQAEHFDLVIVGASDHSNDSGVTIDQITQRLLDDSPCPVMITRAQTQPALAPRSDLTGLEAISILVDKWFAENTFRAS